MKKLKLGNIVTARFLGESFECEVIEVIDKDTYNLKTKEGTFLSSVQWKDKCERNKNRGLCQNINYMIKSFHG